MSEVGEVHWVRGARPDAPASYGVEKCEVTDFSGIEPPAHVYVVFRTDYSYKSSSINPDAYYGARCGVFLTEEIAHAEAERLAQEHTARLSLKRSRKSHKALRLPSGRAN